MAIVVYMEKMVTVTWAEYIGPSNWARNQQTCPNRAAADQIIKILKARKNVKSVRFQGGGQ